MTNIKPFKGVCYNLDSIVDPSQVVCLPYDVISSDDQDFYYHQNPYNFIRLILNRTEVEDDDSNNRYTRSKVFLNDWLKTQILKKDSSEALYFYKQDYFCDDKEFSRIGFIGLMQLVESGIVFPHENTHSAPKTDRLELVKSVKANLSPIFTVFSDKERVVETVFKDFLSGQKPDFLLKDAQGVRNSIWKLTNPEKIQEIKSKLKDKQIFIADGHHRFEVASTYLRLMREQDKEYSVDKSYNYIMTYFTPLESKGLCIKPVHRVVKTKIDIKKLEKSFKVSKCNSVVELQDKLYSFPKKHCAFGIYYRKESLFLELKSKRELKSFFKGRSCFMDLDVAILDFYILKELLKIGKDAIMYTKEVSQAKDQVDCDDNLAAFFLRPTSMKQIMDVALSGEKMPPKSTYFYPKLLSGLVAHKFE